MARRATSHMTHTDRVGVVFHGGIVPLVGLLCGSDGLGIAQLC